jgi:DnaK suppressor protein
MAKSKPKKKAASPTKRPASKPVPKKAAKPAKAKPAAKKAAPAKKPVAKKPVGKTKPAAKKAAPVKKPAPVKAKAAPKPVAKAAPKPEPKPAKRAVAVSARPQPAVAVQPRPAAPPAPTPAPAKPAARPRAADIVAPGVIPSEDQIRRMSDAAYMNEAQLAFFQERLLQMRAEVLTRELDVKERLHQREVFADPADRASAEEEHWLDLRLRERESLLLKKIDDALRRIRDKEYGWCEKTGEAIGIARLLARPTATVCVDIKGQDERAESQYRDR